MPDHRLMRTIACVFFLVCSFCLTGCCRCEQNSADKTGRNKDDGMIQIRKFSVGEDILTVEYRVTSPFSYDIWICEDTDVCYPHQAETRIAGEKLTIRLRLDTDLDFLTENVLSKYRRLSAGRSYSGTLNLELPIRNFWVVRGFQGMLKERRLVILHRAAFEVGYFEGDLLKVISETMEKGRADPDFTPYLEDAKHKNTHDTAYLTYRWRGLRRQKSAIVFINDVDIPCSVAVGSR